ncbi:hypothetical protein ABVT39_021685 [Epinephelus coioides]
MSSCSTIHLTLPQWDGDSRKIRFIHLVNVTSFRLTESPNKSPGTPLFLGADLFSNTDIRTENHPRHHAKFAKKGFATKIHFSSAFRFHGLKDVWKSQINDSPLKMSYSLSVQLDFPLSSSLHDTGSRNVMSQPQHCQADRESAAVCGSDTDDTSADHDYCSFPKQSVQTSSQPLVSTVRQKLHSLDDKLSSWTQSVTEQLETILLLLECVDRYINGNLEEKDVTETVLALLKAKDWDCVYSSSLLCGIGCWLGQQFHAANSSISQKVEGFKVQHIERISDLPPAEELATELFPEAMQTLLLHWMGLSEESTVEKRHSEYPILLLILEFANHNLITGVAHVLYSSLICK